MMNEQDTTLQLARMLAELSKQNEQKTWLGDYLTRTNAEKDAMIEQLKSDKAAMQADINRLCNDLFDLTGEMPFVTEMTP